MSRGIEGAGGRRRRPVDRGVLGGEGDRIWRGGVAIEMEGDRDRVFMKFKIFMIVQKVPMKYNREMKATI